MTLKHDQPVKTIRRVVYEHLKFRTLVLPLSGSAEDSKSLNIIRESSNRWRFGQTDYYGLSVADYELDAILEVFKSTEDVGTYDLSLSRNFSPTIGLIKNESILITLDALWPDFLQLDPNEPQFTRVQAQQTDGGWLMSTGWNTFIFVEPFEIPGYIALLEKAQAFLAEKAGK